MTEPLPCIVTNGGPLIVLPRELLHAWQGVLPPPGTATPPGWTWGDGGIVCDYDRACDPPDEAIAVEDSFQAWTVSVGERRALVLDGECSTTALRWDDGLVVVRDVELSSEAEALAMIAKVAESEWVDTGFELELASGGLSIFDSAYAGAEREEADGGVLETELLAGSYRVYMAYPRQEDGGRTTLVRLLGTRQPGRGLSGVSVR